MNRVRCNFGDIFELHSDKGYRYFQLAASDMTQLNSDVVAVFEGTYPKSQSVRDISTKPVEFYSHTTVRAGMDKYWTKIGHAQPVDTSNALFTDVDSSHEEPFKQASEGPSDHWKTWSIGCETDYIGPYKNVPKSAEIGLVFDPHSLFNRIIQGKYGGVYFGLST